VKLERVAEFGTLVRRRRKQTGLTQAELAERAGVTRQWLSRFEAGTEDASLAKTLSVLEVLEISLTDSAGIRVPTFDVTQLRELNNGLSRVFSDPAFVQRMRAAMNVQVADIPAMPEMERLLEGLRQQAMTIPSVAPKAPRSVETPDQA